MGSKRVSKQSKFMRCFKGPIRVFALARDLYVQSLTGSGGNISYGNAMGCPTPLMPSLPRSFIQNASKQNFKTAEEELRVLIRLAGKVEATELHRTKSSVPLGGSGGAAAVPRSNKVGAFGRIDEDKPFEFREEDKVGLLGEANYPRSRSYAVQG